MALVQVLMLNRNNTKMVKNLWINSRELPLAQQEEVTQIYQKIIPHLLITDQFNSLRLVMLILFLEHQTLMRNNIKKITLILQVLVNTLSKSKIWQTPRIKPSRWLLNQRFLRLKIINSLDQLHTIKLNHRAFLDSQWYQRLQRLEATELKKLLIKRLL